MPACLLATWSPDAAVLLRRRKNIRKAVMRAIMAMEMETPMPAFAPAERLVEVGCVVEIEVYVLFDELVAEGLVERPVERLVEVENGLNSSEENKFNTTVSVLCQATGTPSQKIVLVRATVVNGAPPGKPPKGQFPLAIHTFVKAVDATLKHMCWTMASHVKPLPRIVIQLSSNKLWKDTRVILSRGI
jgi:hypothetical protein